MSAKLKSIAILALGLILSMPGQIRADAPDPVAEAIERQLAEGQISEAVRAHRSRLALMGKIRENPRLLFAVKPDRTLYFMCARMDGRLLRYVPEHYKSVDICATACLSRKEALAFVPAHLKDDVRKEAIRRIRARQKAER